MAKILCTCCHRTAEVKGKHEFVKIPACANGSFIERVTANERVGGKNLMLIRIWNEQERKYEPLVA